MTPVRVLASSALSGMSAFLLVSAAGCGTDAVGVEDCREIELARCEAGEECGIIEDVAACKRFYRDQCLHGLALKDAPSSIKVERCVQTIELAAQCAKLGRETPIGDCEELPTSQTTLTSTCEIVRAPEETVECAFLVEEDLDPPEKDAGGAAGAAGAAGASGGAGAGGT